MKIQGIIPVRGGSKGIKDKGIVEFCGKPLMVHTIENSLNSKYIQETFVSSDSEQILDIAQLFGASIINRPKELATDTSPTEECIEHFLESYNPDIIVLLQATSPLRTTLDIDMAIKAFIKGNFDSLFTASVENDICLWNNKKSITYDYKNRSRRQDREKLYLENGSFYIFKKETFKKYKNRLGGRIGIYKMPKWKSFEIDKYEDIDICEYFMKRIINE